MNITPNYYPINEELARRAHEAMSMRDYRPGEKTADYRRMVDHAAALAERQKQRVDPMYHEEIDRLLDTYARKLAENYNNESRIGCQCPSILIAGGSNFNVRKKEKQNAAMDRNMEEFQKIQGLLNRIQAMGTGGISADDPNALPKLRLKLAALEARQEKMKAANAAIRMKDKAKSDARLAELGFSPDNIAALREPDFAGRIGFPSYQLSNNNANIRRIKERIAELEKRAGETTPEGWEFDGGRVEVNKELNRVQLFFDEKPDADTRTELKSCGFRWAPSQGAWQRQYTDNALRAARAFTGRG